MRVSFDLLARMLASSHSTLSELAHNSWACGLVVMTSPRHGEGHQFKKVIETLVRPILIKKNR